MMKKKYEEALKNALADFSGSSPINLQEYKKLKDEGYKHRHTVHLGSAIPAHDSMPGVHRIAALLQRWLLGTHHGAIQPKQLDYYLDEFVFRFNRRTSRSRGLLFYRLLQQGVATGPVTYKKVIRKEGEIG